MLLSHQVDVGFAAHWPHRDIHLSSSIKAQFITAQQLDMSSNIHYDDVVEIRPIGILHLHHTGLHS